MPVASESPPTPHVVSMGCIPTRPNLSYDWHAHPFDELCLVTESGARMGHAGKMISVQPGTLLLFRAGERHGYWNDHRMKPLFWVLHFKRDDFSFQKSRMNSKDASKRIWKLSEERIKSFKDLFIKISWENSSSDATAQVAERAWLLLLLAGIDRWTENSKIMASMKELDNPRLLALWRSVQEVAGNAQAVQRDWSRSIRNYDSLRHQFQKYFGCSPQQASQRLRFQTARNLLLETSWNIKKVASYFGYARQHEFSRAFHRSAGQSPRDWRRNQLAHGKKDSPTKIGEMD